MIEVVKIGYSQYKDFYALCDNGILLKEINQFLIEMTLTGGKKGNKLSNSSLFQYSYAFKQFFDYLNKNRLIWDEIERKDFQKLVEFLDVRETTSRKRINYLTNLWVRFYLWCNLKKINVQLHIKVYTNTIQLNKDDNFLAHSKLKDTLFTSHEFTFSIPNKRKIRHLSPKTVKSLLYHLKKTDIVYYIVAYFMVTSGLRINGALQLKNNTFPHYLETNHLEWLTYHYIPKGQFDSKETISLNYSLKAWEHISKCFAFIHNRRSEEYYNKYKKWPDKYFLKTNGEELHDYDIWSKFRTVSKKLNLKITPHMLRHTYAVLFVLKYCKKKKIEPTSKTFFWDIHKQLQKNLGHVNISTTMHYCEAAYDYMAIDILDDLAFDIAN